MKTEILEIHYGKHLKVYFDCENQRLEVFKDGEYLPDVAEVEIPKLSHKAFTGDIHDLIVKLSYVPKDLFITYPDDSTTDEK